MNGFCRPCSGLASNAAWSPRACCLTPNAEECRLAEFEPGFTWALVGAQEMYVNGT